MKTESRGPKLMLNGYTYSFEERVTPLGWQIKALNELGFVVYFFEGPDKREAQVATFNWLLNLHEAKDVPLWK